MNRGIVVIYQDRLFLFRLPSKNVRIPIAFIRLPDVRDFCKLLLHPLTHVTVNNLIRSNRADRFQSFCIIEMFQKQCTSDSEKVYPLKAFIARYLTIRKSGVFFSDILTAQPTGAYIQKRKESRLPACYLTIGPLQDQVTWYGINYAGTQMTQWDFQNKGKPGWTGTSSFVLEVPLRHLRPSVIYSVPCDRILQRAYYSPKVE